MDNVFLSVSHGFQVRNFIETPFIHELAKTYNIVLVIDEKDSDFARKFLERLQIRNVEVSGVRVEEKKYEDFFLLLRKNVFVSPKRAQTKNILNELNSKKLEAWQKPLFLINKLFGTLEITRSLWRSFEGLFIRGDEFDKLFEKYKPIKLITADYGTKPFEIRLLRSAKRHGIKSIAVVPSWDNLTSKGVMGIKPDYLAVWNEIMYNEAVELHTFKKENIFITGPLQFDNFFDPSFRIDKDAFNTKFGVRPDQPVIVFGTITPQYFKYNLDILKILKEFIENGTVKRNPKVIIRIHPQVVSNPTLGDNLDQYRNLVSSSSIFSLSLPDIDDWATMQVPLETDFKDLISILTHSSICIASASTLIFDSFACNTSFIGVGFDGNEPPLPKHKSVRRMFEFEHYKNVYQIGGFRIAESKEQLANLINEHLENPNLHVEKQRQTLDQQIKFYDGKNYLRVIDAIKKV